MEGGGCGAVRRGAGCGEVKAFENCKILMTLRAKEVNQWTAGCLGMKAIILEMEAIIF